MIWIALGAALLVSALAHLGHLYVQRSIIADLHALEMARQPAPQPFDDSALWQRLEVLTLAISEGIANVDRAEKRVRATVARARAQLAEQGVVSAGVEAEHSELQQVDGEGSEPAQLQLVPENVAPAVEGDAPSGIPGMTLAQVEQIRTNNAAQA